VISAKYLVAAAAALELPLASASPVAPSSTLDTDVSRGPGLAD